jgi:hypothetical protein
MYKPGSVFVAQYEKGADAWLIRTWSTFTAWMEGKGWRKARWSHVGLIVDGIGMTVEARGKGIVFDSMARFENSPASQIEIYEPRDLLLGTRIAFFAIEVTDFLKGEQYGFVQTFIGVPLTWTVRFIGKTFGIGGLKRAIILGGGQNCVEWTLRTLVKFGVDVNGLDEMSTPEQVSAWAETSAYCGR